MGRYRFQRSSGSARLYPALCVSLAVSLALQPALTITLAAQLPRGAGARAPDRDQFDSFDGDYVWGSDTVTVKVALNGVLTVTFPDQPTIELEPVGDLRFAIKGRPGHFVWFRRSAGGGGIASIYTDLPGRVSLATRRSGSQPLTRTVEPPIPAPPTAQNSLMGRVEYWCGPSRQIRRAAMVNGLPSTVPGRQNSQQCLDALRNAADAGEAEAMARLGWRHIVRHPWDLAGVGTMAVTPFDPKETLVTQDNAVAHSWFRKAADLGNPLAMASLGWMYSMGHGVKQDDVEAARWYRRGADAGEPRAMASLGALYFEERGVARDPAEAEVWLRKAASTGDKRAMAQLALVLLAKSTTPTAASRPPDWNMMSAPQQEAWQRRQPPSTQDEAVRWLEKGCDGSDRYRIETTYGYADPGPWRDPMACYLLGMLYATGSSGVRRDLKVADACFTGTELWNGDSYSGAWYELGNGTTRTLREAGQKRSVEFKTRQARYPPGLDTTTATIGAVVILVALGALLGDYSGSGDSGLDSMAQQMAKQAQRDINRADCMAIGWVWSPPNLCLPPIKR